MDKENKLKVTGVNGPVVTVEGKTSLSMQEMVYVGNGRLIGEVISVNDKYATIQVYESTTGLKPNEPITPTGAPIEVTLGPGLLSGIYDGIARPLDKIEKMSGVFIAPGANVDTLDSEKLWDVSINIKAGDTVHAGQIIASCPETSSIVHKIMIPPNVAVNGGKIKSAVKNGKYHVNDTIAVIEGTDGMPDVNITLSQKWAIRTPRPIMRRLPTDIPLITGQRIIDTLFPIAKGGAAAIPGGFGTGKTMMQHQLAKWSDCDIIVYVGCGERGNEMTQVLSEFSELIDPRTGKSMLDRTLLIANTSNMPVAAREASIYTGVTIAEYYRDMGYNVAMMADSTSRWAEALREISGRLEEMPAEEGFPAYLPSRLSAFYERAGYVDALSGESGSVSLIGAVSPQGSDFSEPVTQNTKRFTRCFWALDKSLAYARHYPAVNWNMSYSEYGDELEHWYELNVAPDFTQLRGEIARILGEENSLMEIVKLIGAELLADDQKLTLEIARIIRVGFLQQNAMHENDSSVPIMKQYLMMKYILKLSERAKSVIAKHIPVRELKEAGVFERLIKAKYEIPNDKLEMFESVYEDIETAIEKVEQKYKI